MMHANHVLDVLPCTCVNCGVTREALENETASSFCTHITVDPVLPPFLLGTVLVWVIALPVLVGALLLAMAWGSVAATINGLWRRRATS